MIENHMVANTPDAPWNAPDQPQWECNCGLNHSHDVKREGYPKWHARGRFVDECSGNCGRRCCHECAVACRICGQRYCPSCRKGFHEALSLCEDCGATYAVIGLDSEVEKLIAIERKRQVGAASFHAGALLDSDIAWLIAAIKEAREYLAGRAA